MVVKVLTFYRRNPNISKEEFSRLWREVGRICQTSEDIQALMYRYIQHELQPAGNEYSESSASEAGATTIGYDAMAEVWFYSQEAEAAVRETKTFKEKLWPLEVQMIDWSEATPTMIDTQFVQIVGPGG
ncbi:EthD domain-containing protein [Tsuneonella sp. CC-YZS046]|uniref:EthD domain-containing protein n=1 Tax=Tsuneonella sp. CC-YZS046 TaxID=3042152 RepID=UPI002D781521|nr:EthD domain-containing protein [Tsuneonella sp. CC-YZS046]WRO66660.1 EthD domain-containing protein [Tsuneonella sp. CC-YZS046]